MVIAGTYGTLELNRLDNELAVGEFINQKGKHRPVTALIDSDGNINREDIAALSVLLSGHIKLSIYHAIYFAIDNT